MVRNAIEEFLDNLDDQYGIYIHFNDFEDFLTQHGLMIVPIEDPTNLRYGAEDE